MFAPPNRYGRPARRRPVPARVTNAPEEPCGFAAAPDPAARAATARRQAPSEAARLRPGAEQAEREDPRPRRPRERDGAPSADEPLPLGRDLVPRHLLRRRLLVRTAWRAALLVPMASELGDADTRLSLACRRLGGGDAARCRDVLRPAHADREPQRRAHQDALPRGPRRRLDDRDRRLRAERPPGSSPEAGLLRARR